MRSRIIVDTNVAVTANGKASPQASLRCVRQCILALAEVKRKRKLCIDDGYQIVREYRANLNEKGQPGPGDAFLLWVLQNFKNPDVCERVTITPDAEHGDYLEFPSQPPLDQFDRSDRKFAAVAAVPGAPVLNAVDKHWWIFRKELEQNRIRVTFVCPDHFEGK